MYLRTTPDVAYSRVLGRARSEEITISLEYLNQLHDLHEMWLSREQEANMSNISDMPVSNHSSSTREVNNLR